MPKATRNLSLSQGTSHSDKKPAKTRNHSSKSHSLERKLEFGGRWTRSGKNNACPICDRTKDNKCAWKKDVINCYNGVTNYPPQDLNIGNTFEMAIGSIVDGRWALVAKNKGFSSNHWVFIPDKPLDNTKQITPRAKDKVSIPKLNRLFNVLSENVSEAIFPELMILNFQQLEAVSVKTDEALAETKIVLALSKQFSQKELINDIQLSNLFETTKAYLHKLNNRAEQIKQFRAVCLGEEEFLDNI